MMDNPEISFQITHVVNVFLEEKYVIDLIM